MKRLITITLLAALLLALALPAAAQEKSPAKKRSILLELQLESHLAGRDIAIAPKVLVADGKKAEIKVGGRHAMLNGKAHPIEGKDKATMLKEKDKKDQGDVFITSIAVTPRVIRDEEPVLIDVDMEMKVVNHGKVFTRNFQFTTIDGQPWRFRSKDPKDKSVIKMTIVASIYRGQFDKKK